MEQTTNRDGVGILDGCGCCGGGERTAVEASGGSTTASVTASSSLSIFFSFSIFPSPAFSSSSSFGGSCRFDDKLISSISAISCSSTLSGGESGLVVVSATPDGCCGWRRIVRWRGVPSAPLSMGESANEETVIY